MTWQITGNGAWTTEDDIVLIDQRQLEMLREASRNTPRKRARLCAHHSVDDPLHEMIIAMDRATYVRPHRHLAKSESFHIIEGEACVLVFDEDGRVHKAVELGDYPTGKPFFYRIASPLYHTVLLRTSCLVLHETTQGPLDPAATHYAPWAPDEEAPAGEIEAYLACLRSHLVEQGGAGT